MKETADSFRYELRSSQQLKELSVTPLPLGMRAGRTVRSLHRDLYLDTAEDTLRHRGVMCRLRLGATDDRMLSLRIRGAEGMAPVRVDSSVRASDVDEVLKENTEAGRRLRALVDPDYLVVRLELEVERLTRRANPDWLRRPQVEMHYDEIVARRNGFSRAFQLLCIHRRRGDPGEAQRLADALEREHGVRPIASDARESAELLLRWSRNDRAADRDTNSDSFPRISTPTVNAQLLPEFLNPELSLLAFQTRVLALAEDAATPIGERLRFLSIVTANVDEFYMVRMAGLKRAAREQYEEQCDDGLTHAEQLERIVEQVQHIVERQERCWFACRHELEKRGVRLVDWSDLDDAQRAQLRAECIDEIQPSLTPMAMTLSPGHPLPHLPHLTLALAVVIRRQTHDRLHLAEVELPAGTSRFLAVPGQAFHFIQVEEVIRSNLDLVYPDAFIDGAYVFRVTRGGDLELDEDAAADLRDAVTEAASRRPRNPAIRLEVERGTPGFVRELLLENLRRELGAAEVELESSDVQEIDGLIDLRGVDELPLPDAPGIRYPEFCGTRPIPASRPMVDAIRERDLLFHHPFDTFAFTVIRFLDEAAADPDVTAIKITLYRTGDPSPIVEKLLEASRQGKQVVTFVELKARFEEEQNVGWARKLESAGGHVVYGLVGFKNHAKVCLVVRRERGKLARYVHIGTGNYNARSGLQYTDLSLFSAREDLAADAGDLFNALTGGSRPPQGLSRGCLVSPSQLVEEVLALISREAAIARAGRPARITAKLNGLSDAEVVRALYRASSDGVQIDLVVRGICTLRPGIPGRSERIRVMSVVGRFLEHSRIYRFGNDGAPLYYIGSADLRPRNLRRRVELLVPVVEPTQRAYLDHVLELYKDDGTAWDLTSSGEYIRRSHGGVGAQSALMAEAEARTANAG
jgi:polyphosphate kinase